MPVRSPSGRNTRQISLRKHGSCVFPVGGATMEANVSSRPQVDTNKMSSPLDLAICCAAALLFSLVHGGRGSVRAEQYEDSSRSGAPPSMVAHREKPARAKVLMESQVAFLFNLQLGGPLCGLWGHWPLGVGGGEAWASDGDSSLV